MIVHSYPEGWSSIFAFKHNGGTMNYDTYGDRAPALFFHKNGFFHFTNAVNGNLNHVYDVHNIKLNQLYKIKIEQQMESDGKVGLMLNFKNVIFFL